MNENSLLKTQVIKDWLLAAAARLKNAGIPTPRLDAEIILAHTLRKSRTYLHAHDDEQLESRNLEIADARIELRLDRTPVAYIIGHKEFYGRPFKVTPATLIPRPDSETIITLLDELLPPAFSLIHDIPKRLVDIGTGSGCLGITAKLEHPELDITICDISNHALNVAKSNAKALKAEVTPILSDLLTDYPFSPDIIIANLPYVDPEWERSPETNYEPALALFADNDGLALIYKLIDEASPRITANGLVFLEADPRQHAAISTYAKTRGFAVRAKRGFIIVLEKL
ncbi:MAG TPA: peptide chain release factor N(5)-glutamine methyltransferase [Candidatus Chromulinivoraceae bacterium]|nr:peptide chain release factor N(5)-glutamine methyltransferase [Candidatus Chromulinivoraceae bacterium]